MSLFGGNADIKYPLDEFHEEDFPNAMLLDLSLSIPDGMDPVLAAFRTGLGYAFISIEERTTGVPIACALVQSPGLARVYQLDMSVPGFGWVVFGPTAVQGNTFFSGPVEIGIDPEAVIPIVPSVGAVVFAGKVNGFDMLLRNVLAISSDTDLITVTANEGTITLSRNDSVLSQQDRIDLINSSAGINAGIISSIDGVLPDDNGNIDIVVNGCLAPCSNTHELVIPRGDTGQGTQQELPLDTFNPRTPDPSDPCRDSSESAVAAVEVSSGYDICHEVTDTGIKDRNNSDNLVGSIMVLPEQALPETTSSTVP